ncbi:hypothetical protein EK21DRAFT_115054 [Setomelanomma holmii]|uniref:BZIP transcription factor n=1 Tax=Setomelanomma holmii TaxID=210430 RepID=A0A9P4H4M3_9PLEO|nr:hypothetical protein EK21DRAFT_115054 [Setomelanomma holmii]
MNSIRPPFLNGSDDEIVQTGKAFGYGNWLQPIINANDATGQVTDEASKVTPLESPSAPVPARRGRGRPRVARPRDESAIEKRRAQVREAQRAYQKRKDSVNVTEKRRVDVLLQLLSDLSTDVEALLGAASTGGNMYRDDTVSKCIQGLWSTYDTVINNDEVKPELRLLQVKNSRRLVDHQANANLRIVFGAREPVSDPLDVDPTPPEKGLTPFDPSAVNFELVRFEETTVMSSFQRTGTADRYMAGRNIFDICKERQAAMKEADRRLAEG